MTIKLLFIYILGHSKCGEETMLLMDSNAHPGALFLCFLIKFLTYLFSNDFRRSSSLVHASENSDTSQSIRLCGLYQ
jgi:hypothetical protein